MTILIIATCITTMLIVLINYVLIDYRKKIEAAFCLGYCKGLKQGLWESDKFDKM